MILTILSSSFICIVSILILRIAAQSLNLIDRPDYRKKHEEPIPMIGGLAIYISLVLTSLLFKLPYILDILIFSSSIVLIIGLLEPTSGSIEIDGIVLDQNNTQSWQRKIGYVPQQPYLVKGSLADNIAFAVEKEEINENLIMECCKSASMEDILEDAPQGIHTEVGERGALFSGGQMQRIAIARALYRNPDVLILDEATSALDKENERKWQECLNNLKGRMTTLIISHKLYTIESCDTIIYLQAGKIMDKKISEVALESPRDQQDGRE